ncbi:MAG: YdcF family protein [Halioglobus sp.]
MLSLLVYPLSQALLLGILALCLWLLRCGRAGVIILAVALAWLYLCSTALVADRLMASLERDYPPRALSATPESEAIVLLGGATRGDTHMGTLGDMNQQADRLVHAVALYKAGRAPLVLLSGGGQTGGRTEAEVMRDILLVMGIPDKALLLERGSRTTYDNAVNSARLLQARGLDSILLVTSAFHMRRAEASFAAQGLQVIPAPTDYQRLVMEPVLPRWLPTVDDLARSTYALREHVGYWVYRLQGRFQPRGL